MRAYNKINYLILNGYNGVFKVSINDIKRILKVKSLGSFILNYTMDDTEYLIKNI